MVFPAHVATTDLISALDDSMFKVIEAVEPLNAVIKRFN